MKPSIQQAFDGLDPPGVRLALLELLGFIVDPEYQTWAEQDLRYDKLYYEVQSELQKCYIKGQWRNPDTMKKIQP